MSGSVCNSVPVGESGDWRVTGSPVRRLERAGDGVIFMEADHPHEVETQGAGIEEAKRRGGHVLTTGLGLGMFVERALESPAVECVTVVEGNPDVVALVWPTISLAFGGRVRLIEADARAYTPDRRYTTIWHDIWPTPNAEENRADRAAMEPRYAPWCDWQGFWECNPCPS